MHTRGHLRLESVANGLAVLVDDADGFTTVPGYVLDGNGLREEPRLLAGFPAHPDRRAPGSGRSLDGQIHWDGPWPASAQAVDQHMPQGGCIGCWDRYEWQRDHWVHLGGPEFLPDWWDPSVMGPRESTVSLPNGKTLWEKFEFVGDSDEYYLFGRSTFFEDPHGLVRSRRQRARALTGCKGGTRLMGRFFGVGLADGGMLSVGRDCRTGVVSAELWRGTTNTSEVRELPGRPRDPLDRSPFGDCYAFGVHSAEDVVVGFGMPVEDGERPFLAAHTGQRWLDLSPPIAGRIEAIVRPADGSIWLVLDQEAWRHPGVSTPSAAWSKACEGASLGGSGTVELDPEGEPWLATTSSLFEYGANGCVEHSLPRVQGTGSAGQYGQVSLRFLPSSEPVVVASASREQGESEMVLLLTRVPPEVTER